MHLQLGDKEQIDFHRWVMFLSHRFNDKISMFSELEVEHSLAGDDKPGEVEIEQAYVEIDMGRGVHLKAGLFLLPVGILNETHEPNTFYGTERNPIESEIIPSTWWEAGGMLSGYFDNGVTTDVAVTSALRIPAGSEYEIRKGRQKVAEANAEDVALTGRIVWRGMPGLETALTVGWQENIAAAGEKTPAVLTETHVVYERGPIGLRALYSRWDLVSDSAEALGQDQQYGFYIEPSYKIIEQVGVFARYNQWNTSAGSEAGASKKRQYDIGINYWPHPRVVLKLDGQIQQHAGGQGESNGVNFGMGYQF